MKLNQLVQPTLAIGGSYGFIAVRVKDRNQASPRLGFMMND
jgi:hypothetical protein